MKKRFVSLCIALTMMSLLLPMEVAAEEQQVVYASTTEELLAALKPNKKIILEGKDYNILLDDDAYDARYTHGDLGNLTIQGTVGTRIVGVVKKPERSNEYNGYNGESYSYDPIISFDSGTIELRDLAIGYDIDFSDFNPDRYDQSIYDHSIYEYGILDMEGVSKLSIINCELFGGNGAAIRTAWAADGVFDLNMENSTVRNCLGSIMKALELEGASFTKCIFSGNGNGEGTAIYGNSYSEIVIPFSECTFENNRYQKFFDWESLGDDMAPTTYSLKDCAFRGNSWEDIGNTSISNNEPAESTTVDEYLYDVSDSGENIMLPTAILDNVSDIASAVNAVKQMTDGMTSEQKSSATGVDLATLYAETAASKVASKEIDGREVIISATSVAELETASAQAVSAVETALVNGGVTTARYLTNTVTLTTDEEGEISIKIDPDILTTKVDKIRVETPDYALTLKTADLAEDLTEILTITAEEVGSGFAPGKANRKVTVKLTLPKGKTTNPVTVSLPADTGSTTYQAVVKTDGSATSSKYNPATTTMDGKVNTSGTYTVKTNEKSFTDISNKSAEMQKAILYLTSKGIINGTSATTFSPNGTINRQQVAALLMRALGKVDNSATVSFKDVSANSSLYHEIASSKKHKIINGYSDNTFRGTNVISKAQIVTVAGRVLVSEMNYKTPANTNSYLGKYSDAVPDFAKEMTALATRENLVVYRTDGTFSGNKNMTRGDAAIILYRLFQKIW